MTSLAPELLQWLVSVLTPSYKDVNRTYSDVATTLQAFPTLSPRTDVFTHENGTSELLLCISGILPVSFRGASYNIPVIFWLPHHYPWVPPTALVVPSSGMAIRPTNHVDPSGRCYHPYLTYWSKNPNLSFLVDLCAQLKDVFSKEPPVYAKSSRPEPPTSSQQAPPPRPPLPPELAPKPSLSQQPSPQQHPPAPPPKPSKEAPSNTPGAAGQTPGPAASSPQHHQQQPPAPPPAPPKPVELSHSHSHSHSYSHSGLSYTPDHYQHRPDAGIGSAGVYRQNTPPRTSSLPPQAQGGYPPQQGGPPQIPAKPRDTSLDYRPAPSLPGQPGHAGPPPPPLPPSHVPLQMHPSQHNMPPPQDMTGQPQSWQQSQEGPAGGAPFAQPTQQATAGAAQPRFPIYAVPPRPVSIHGYPPNNSSPLNPNILPSPQRAPEQKKPILDIMNIDDGFRLTARDVVPPPLPPNPEKDRLLNEIALALDQRAKAAKARALTSLEQTSSQSEAMMRTEAAIERERLELKRTDEICVKDTRILNERIAMADDLIKDAREREAPNIDAVVVAPTVVHTQLYELVTEDMAIEDTIYVLGKALDRERITLDVFLKHTRNLAREQFMKRALVKKISRQVGLT